MSSNKKNLADNYMHELLEEKFPEAPAFPIQDKVKQLGLDTYEADDAAFYADLQKQNLSFYFDKKNIPEIVAKKYIPDISRRFIECEKQIKRIEELLMNIPNKEEGLNEMRFDILTELLDKACQGLDIWEAHVEKKIPCGHRVVLEAHLCNIILSKFEIITKICKNFGKMGEDRESILSEAEWLRYEIRSCDMIFSEIHEKFLKSYLGMNW